MKEFLEQILQSEPVWLAIHAIVTIVVAWVANKIPFIWELVNKIPFFSTNKLTSWIVSILVGVVGYISSHGAVANHSWVAMLFMSVMAAFASNGVYDWRKSLK